MLLEFRPRGRKLSRALTELGEMLARNPEATPDRISNSSRHPRLASRSGCNGCYH